jgi:hypothetical protein
MEGRVFPHEDALLELMVLVVPGGWLGMTALRTPGWISKMCSTVLIRMAACSAAIPDMVDMFEMSAMDPWTILKVGFLAWTMLHRTLSWGTG